MSRKIIVAMAAVFLCGYLFADLLLEQISPTYNRGNSSSYYTTNSYLEGAYITITNCIIYSSSDNTATQDLTNLGGYFTVGNTRTSSNYNWTAQGASTGTVTATIRMPTNGLLDCGVWLTLTNATGQSYTYPGETRLYLRTPFK